MLRADPGTSRGRLADLVTYQPGVPFELMTFEGQVCSAVTETRLGLTQNPLPHLLASQEVTDKNTQETLQSKTDTDQEGRRSSVYVCDAI